MPMKQNTHCFCISGVTSLKKDSKPAPSEVLENTNTKLYKLRPITDVKRKMTQRILMGKNVLQSKACQDASISQFIIDLLGPC